MSEIDAAALNWSDLGTSELVSTGSVTLLLADLEGSTSLWETQPLGRYQAVLTSARGRGYRFERRPDVRMIGRETRPA